MTNPYFPLPENYPKLSSEEKRLARVAAVRDDVTPERAVYSWAFFRSYYLDFLPIGDWYQPPKHPSPPAHYRFIHDIYSYPRNVKGYRRAFAKSTLIDELNLKWAVSRSNYVVLVVKSSDDFVQSSTMKLMLQLENNERILEDFGHLRPKKSQGIWNMNRLRLTNGFQLIGRSVMGRLPGLRPRFIWVDDAEQVKDMRVSASELTDNFKRMFFNQLMPMLEEGACAALVGTLYSKRLFLYYMATTSESEDPRVSFWNREVLGAWEADGSLIWPEKWSTESLEKERLSYGEESYRANVMNQPGSVQDNLLPLNQPYCWYAIEGEHDPSSPLTSEASLVSFKKTSDGSTERIVRPFGETVSKMYRILLADPIKNPSRTSDFACCMVVGVERNPLYRDHVWILDLKLGRVKEPIFISWLWNLGLKWRVKICGIESVSVQKKLVERTSADFAERAISEGWMPRVKPIRYQGDFRSSSDSSLSKGSRIASLAWRFEANRILLPRLEIHRPPWADLVYQIEHATEDLQELTHDDAVDTLAMVQFAVKGKIYSPETSNEPDSYADMLNKGLSHLPGTPIPIVLALSSKDLKPDLLQALGNLVNKREEAERKRQKTRDGGRRVLMSPRSKGRQCKPMC